MNSDAEASLPASLLFLAIPLTQCTFIERGEVWEVLAALRELGPRRKATRKVVEELVTYLTNNKDRMDYPEYRAKGYRVSSGSVESANYHVTGARLKQQGMRWSEKGAAKLSRLPVGRRKSSMRRFGGLECCPCPLCSPDGVGCSPTFQPEIWQLLSPRL